MHWDGDGQRLGPEESTAQVAVHWEMSQVGVARSKQQRLQLWKW